MSLENSLLFDIPETPKSIIKVLGVGGGGGNAVSYMYKQGIKGVDFAICNTDHQSMENSPIPVKIQLGPELTDGMGAGAQPEIGKQSCIESIDEIRKFLSDDTKMLFITAGMGGGTGTGAAPIIAKAAREMDILTVAIVTLPFSFEGKMRKTFASKGIQQLKDNVDSLLVISNQKLFKIFSDMTLEEAFEEADSVLTTAAKGIAEIITVQGNINVDFKDVNTVMRDSGVAIMGSSTVEGDDRAIRAIKQAINSPLLEDNDIRGAKHILLNIASGTKKVTMMEISQITDFVTDEAGENTNVIWGNSYDENLGEKLNITLIATGFDKDLETIVEVKKPERVMLSLNDEVTTTPLEQPVIFDLQEVEEKEEVDDIKSTIQGYKGTTINTLELAYDTDNERQRSLEKEKRAFLESERLRRAQLRNEHTRPLDDPSTIADMESIPAYKRRRVQLDVEVSNQTGTEKSKLSIDEDGRMGFDRNSFLHDNVD